MVQATHCIDKQDHTQEGVILYIVYKHLCAIKILLSFKFLF